MSPLKLNIAMIYGSARKHRFGDVIGGWLVDRLGGNAGISLEIVDPRELEISIRHETDTVSARQLRASLARADGFIVLTPEYNRSYPAALKAVLDLADKEWQAKPVAFVSYGGVSGGLRAVEQLRLVFAELHAVSVRDGVSFAGPWDFFDDGQFTAPAGAEQALSLMLERLLWWAGSLKSARELQPYQKVV